jgi:hypothetical protein
MAGNNMNDNRVRSIAGIFMLTLMSGCVGYTYPYGNYGYRNYQGYQPHREYGEYREHGYNRGGGGYGQYRQYDND